MRKISSFVSKARARGQEVGELASCCSRHRGNRSPGRARSVPASGQNKLSSVREDSRISCPGLSDEPDRAVWIISRIVLVRVLSDLVQIQTTDDQNGC